MKKIEKRILNYLKERNWHEPIPSNLAKSIMIEGAELLELFQWENLSIDELKKDKEKMEEIKKELADVLIYAIEMSVLLGLDTKKVIEAKLAYIDKKYPAKLMRKNAKKDSGSGQDSLYWKTKKDHRKKGL